MYKKRVFKVKGGEKMPIGTKKIEEQIEEYADMVYRLAFSRTKSKEEAEDIFQEVFLTLHQKKPEFENKEHEKAWIIRVTINKSKKLLNSSWKKKQTLLEKELKEEFPEENMEILEEVLTLPLKYRTIIHLFYYEGYSVKQISKLLHLTESNVKMRLARARKKLKEQWEGGEVDGK